MGENGIAHVTRNEFEQVNGEMVENIVDLMNAVNTMKQVINTQAEVIGLHRYILEKFVPAPLLESAAKEYKNARQREILTQTTPSAHA